MAHVLAMVLRVQAKLPQSETLAVLALSISDSIAL